MKGKTKSGFEFDVEETVLDNFEILEDLVLIDEHALRFCPAKIGNFGLSKNNVNFDRF